MINIGNNLILNISTESVYVKKGNIYYKYKYSPFGRIYLANTFTVKFKIILW